MAGRLKPGDKTETKIRPKKLVAPRRLWQPPPMPTRQGAIRLFTLFGITVYLHWSWFLILLYVIQSHGAGDSSTLINVLGLLTLFFIVLLHEFGHQLACRSVGGQTHDIVLWPLGGVAYVAPPQRPGAMLWSIAAGPLVNVVLYLIATVLLIIGVATGLTDQMPVLWGYLAVFAYLNLILLEFNLLPIFPLDGGQIVRSLLWFKFGRARSMMIATIIGFIGIAALIPYVIIKNYGWYYIVAAFIAYNCWLGFQQARALMRVANAPRRAGFACPSCHTAPPIGEFWRCGKCGNALDVFLTQFACPHCGTEFKETLCVDCGMANPIKEWGGASPANQSQ